MHDLERRVQAAKDNVEAIGQLMTKWCDAPLYERKGEKKDGLLNIEVWFRVLSVWAIVSDYLAGAFRTHRYQGPVQNF